MNEYIEAIIRAQKKGVLMCPRCGSVRMKAPISTNALSRRADGCYVCDECGMAEALADACQVEDSLERWEAVKLFKEYGIKG